MLPGFGSILIPFCLLILHQHSGPCAMCFRLQQFCNSLCSEHANDVCVCIYVLYMWFYVETVLKSKDSVQSWTKIGCVKSTHTVLKSKDSVWSWTKIGCLMSTHISLSVPEIEGATWWWEVFILFRECTFWWSLYILYLLECQHTLYLPECQVRLNTGDSCLYSCVPS